MPYSRTLSQFVLPEFEAEAPDSWERRLREISPILPNTSHLRFRKFAPEIPYNPNLPAWAQDTRGDWYWPERPIWALYSCTPRHLVTPEKAALLATHWSECFDEGEQVAHRRYVSDYQHFMWHTQGVSVAPFLLLQGTWGGTPAKFSDRERAVLRGSGEPDEPFPIGFFPACPFDERVVKAVLERDRLVQSGNRFDELEKMDRPDWKRAEDDAAELVYRDTLLESLRVMNAPAFEFMKSYQFQKEAEDYLPPAPKGLPNVLATWKDVFRETGQMIGATAPSQRKVFATS